MLNNLQESNFTPGNENFLPQQPQPSPSSNMWPQSQNLEGQYNDPTSRQVSAGNNQSLSNTQVSLESHFATPTGFGYNTELATHYLPIIKRILDEQANTEFFWKGRTTHGQSNFQLVNHPEMGLLKDFVWDVSKQYLQKCGFDPNYLKGDIFLIANALEKDSFHKSHYHYDCLLSGVYYLQVPDNSAPLEFEDPVFARNLQYVPIIDETNPHTWKTTFLYPNTGYYTVFPHWHRHAVLPNDSMDSRIAISWNIS
tara:strand:+ start:3823 stop:4584 length:762 start_codon:yes stop_codon:yes gene_type:complete